ncbi:MAG TPA: BlaI/MecI/CopY family transcriptional regulator [Clostridia bacterium]|nr:BlaI/MecI/CopY family transcriptional regulator [Clostridiales bacterium]
MKDDGQMIGGKKMAGKKETDSRSTENRIKLFDSELKLMELLWANEGATAKELAVLAADQIGWNKNTTYTVIKKLVAKGAIKRTEPNFVCHSLITREEVGRDEARKVLRSFFGGSVKMLFSSFMADGTLSDEEAEELRKLIDEHSRS